MTNWMLFWDRSLLIGILTGVVAAGMIIAIARPLAEVCRYVTQRRLRFRIAVHAARFFSIEMETAPIGKASFSRPESKVKNPHHVRLKAAQLPKVVTKE